MKSNPDSHQSCDHNEVIGTEITDAVEGQQAVEMVPINHEFSKGDPAEKVGRERGELRDKGQLGEGDLFHGSSSNAVESPAMPLQARLKSSPESGPKSGIEIGALAALAGVRTSAIRYYEASGLMPRAARRSGRRVYDSGDIRRLRLIVTGRRLGFSIAELKAVSASSSDPRQTAQQQAEALRERVAKLTETASMLD